jgi:hypothetical protein
VYEAIAATNGWTKPQMLGRMKGIAERRNKIAHAGDRAGWGKADISVSDVRSVTDDLTRIVLAADSILSDTAATTDDASKTVATPPSPPKAPSGAGARPTVKRPPKSATIAARLFAEMQLRPGKEVSPRTLAPEIDIDRTAVANYLWLWSGPEFDDQRYQGIERVRRGVYRYTDASGGPVTRRQEAPRGPRKATKADRLYAFVASLPRGEFTVSQVVDASGLDRTLVGNCLWKWAQEGFDDARYPGVVSVRRGVYRLDR